MHLTTEQFEAFHNMFEKTNHCVTSREICSEDENIIINRIFIENYNTLYRRFLVYLIGEDELYNYIVDHAKYVKRNKKETFRFDSSLFDIVNSSYWHPIISNFMHMSITDLISRYTEPKE